MFDRLFFLILSNLSPNKLEISKWPLCQNTGILEKERRNYSKKIMRHTKNREPKSKSYLVQNSKLQTIILHEIIVEALSLHKFQYFIYISASLGSRDQTERKARLSGPGLHRLGLTILLKFVIPIKCLGCHILDSIQYSK